MADSALLFTDVVDSTLRVEQIGDTAAAQLWTEHDRRARDLLARHHGREIDRTDGFFLLFDAPLDALRYALDYHAALAELQLRARVGLHVGPVVLRENRAQDIARGAKPVEVEGLAKPFAARVMALAAGGQTLLSAAARTALGDALPDGTVVESHGHYRVKGVEAPIEIFEVGVQGFSGFAPPPDTDKAYRVVQLGDHWSPLRAIRNNLPGEPDAFVGRASELRMVAQRLDAGARLLTVLGPGGTGKTRLVRRYGLTWLGDWPGGVYFCDLSDAHSIDDIHSAVAVALGIPLGRAEPGLQLGHAIAGRGRCLLILDNFEQVVEHAVASLGRWLGRATEAAFIVTSRARLQLPGEAVVALDPLPVGSDAIELFVQRARAQQADFMLGEGNRAAVAEVVRLLDGLPLAIELAAARTRVLSPAQLVERLSDRFRVLAGARGAAARQATLRAAIDWSWNLLAPWEQAAFAQCSVFEHRFTLQAAERVLDLRAWPDAPETIDAIQALVDKSLLRSWVPAEQARHGIEEPCFGMLLNLREYAAEKLPASGPAARDAAEQRHERYFAGFGTDDAIESLYRHGGIRKRRLLALELENLVAACRRAAGRGHGDTAVAAFRAAWEVLDLQGPYALGAALGDPVLALDALTPPLRVKALWTRAQAAWRAGRMDDAAAGLAQAQALARDLRDRRHEGLVLYSLGNLNGEQGRMDEAQRCYEAALAIQREVGQVRLQGMILANLGNVHGEQSRAEAARSCYDAALAIHREIGNRSSEGTVLGNLGNLLCDQGRMDEARASYLQALAIAREVGSRTREGSVLGNLGILNYEQGRLDEARAHLEAALAIHREVGNRPVEAIVLANIGVANRDQGRMDEALAHLEAALAIHREVGNRRDEGFVLGNLGLLHAEQGRRDDAQQHLQAALAAHREVGNRRHEAAAIGALADLQVQQGHVARAVAMLAEGESILREVADPMELGKLLCIRGHAELKRGAVDAAQRALHEAESLATTTGAGPGSALRRAIAGLRAALQ
ncbi:MAG: tetratricopeptide repeat protein [Burkholderiaceae bacterium]|nr:tetratricopeptide repeat protein [Burkholderiaceae bacterium]